MTQLAGLPVRFPNQQTGTAMTQPERSGTQLRRAVLSSYLGSVIEYYDFLLYATASAVVFNKVFFANLDPLVVSTINQIGEAMRKRFDEEGKPGYSSHMLYDIWWNGSMRGGPDFHNMAGFLTETALYRYATPHCYAAEEIPEIGGAIGQLVQRVAQRHPRACRMQPHAQHAAAAPRCPHDDGGGVDAGHA